MVFNYPKGAENMQRLYIIQFGKLLFIPNDLFAPWPLGLSSEGVWFPRNAREKN